MKGLKFDLKLWKVALKKMRLAGKFSMIKYKDNWPDPVIEYPNQIIIKTEYGGICGSDLHQLQVEVSYFTTILANKENPFPIGHEVVGIVQEVGKNVTNFKPGDRVIFDPVPTCEAYGFDLCPSCKMGNFASCFCLSGKGDGSKLEERYGGRGNFGGYSGGGFSEKVIGFEHQFFKVPDNVPSKIAVLSEPFAVAIHAISRYPPRDFDHIIIIGAGIIGLLLIAAIRAYGYKSKITTLARYKHQAEQAKHFGSDEVIIERNQKKLYEKVAAISNGTLFKPTIGKSILSGNLGPDIIYDCVANEHSIDDALHLVRSNGKIVLLGLDFSVTKKIDWSFVAYKEIEVVGSMIYGMEEFKGKKLSAFEIALQFFADDPEKYANLVTHKVNIEDYRKAYEIAMNKGKNKAIKVVFEYS